jgi:hypothetical protein
MTLDYRRPARLPAARFIPLICLGAWILLAPVAIASRLLNPRPSVISLTVVSVVGLLIPILALFIGLRVFLQIRRETGFRDNLLSWSLAANAALLLFFGFLLLLIWPVVLKSP